MHFYGAYQIIKFNHLKIKQQYEDSIKVDFS